MRTTDCPACGKRIVWLPTQTGGFQPVDADHPNLATYHRWNPHKFTAHYQTCSHAQDRYLASVAKGRSRSAALRMRHKEEVAQ